MDFRLAEALAIQAIHGAAGPRWIAEMIGTLAQAGDVEGVTRFTEIAERYDTLLSQTKQ